MCDIIWAGTILNIRFVMGLGLSHKRRHVQTLNSAPAYAPIDTGAPVKAAWDSGPRYMSMISSGGAGNAAARSIVSRHFHSLSEIEINQCDLRRSFTSFRGVPVSGRRHQ